MDHAIEILKIHSTLKLDDLKWRQRSLDRLKCEGSIKINLKWQEIMVKGCGGL
jgi:hypothetical protein